MRLDAWLVDHGHFETRARAQAAVKAGLVAVDGATAAKPAQTVREGAAVSVSGDVHPWVSRGGVKLAAALDAFAVDPAGRVCLDLGASTGGFTDVVLTRGAGRVYAVDVGREQLHAKLRGDARVVALEGTHAKDLGAAQVPEPVSLLVCDVSFISLRKALPPALELTAPGADLVALVKPQFELGPARVGKGGLVMGDPADALADIGGWIDGLDGWATAGDMESPVKGGDGNTEYLLHARKA